MVTAETSLTNGEILSGSQAMNKLNLTFNPMSINFSNMTNQTYIMKHLSTFVPCWNGCTSLWLESNA